MTHIRFNEDIEHYDPSDSETEYTEKEKNLLKNVRTKRPVHSDSEEEVYGLDQESSDDSNIAESDIEGQEDDELPDVRAWGSTKRAFYSTDYVDPDYGGYEGKDAVSADLEEEEARTIQKRLAEQLDDDDFTLDIFNKKAENELEKDEEVIKKDLSSLSKRQLLDLLRKESPEFFELVEDYKEKMGAVREYLAPIMEWDKKGQIPDCKALDFVKTYYNLILNYCTNINMYLLLKASRVNVQHHPVIKRLYQYRQLIAQLEPAYIEIIKPQLDIIIEGNRDKDDENVEETVIKINKKKTTKLKLLEKHDKNKKLATKDKELDEDKNIHISDKPENDIISIIKTKKNKETKNVSFETRSTEKAPKFDNKASDSESAEETNEINEEKDEDQSEDTKRAITYQMAKNKGLTPHRKKEQRNPRVKHRNKYRKAQIRRKGAVREVRKELSRYGGEISGIKMSVSKSIKIK